MLDRITSGTEWSKRFLLMHKEFKNITIVLILGIRRNKSDSICETSENSLDYHI